MTPQPSASMHYLYRLLRAQDDPSQGLSSTDPSANISVKEHVERGGLHVKIDSQYISTSMDRMAVLSGDRTLKPYYNGLVRKHQEILVRPNINRDAILGTISYDGIEGSWEKGIEAIDAIIRQHHCTQQGHDVSEWSVSEESDWSASEETDFSASEAADFSDSERADFSDSEEVGSSDSEETGSSYSEEADSLTAEELETTETADEQRPSDYCNLCDEHGHNEEACPKFARLSITGANED
ncbi:hypothetical protein BGZ73_001400 [Actinomortierella ambigua]|nr:hypothetical protein BGZ73_001389 [Actinomortierella ambigua]KAF9975077.1 hypothetical protein BGZ73_001400 [Actinomortierella ambigua]